MSKLERIDVLDYSGVGRIEKYLKTIKPIKKEHYVVEEITLPGDAPKDFIRLYQYEPGVRRHNRNTWTRYISKIGHKWYPMESITEYLLNRIGEELGFMMSSSSLAQINGQVRFLSRYFLKEKEEVLVHGADIFAGYLQDKDFAEEIEIKGMARELFTFQFAEEAVKARFPSDKEQIMVRFAEMLLFDAIVGNNDRHFYNWAVIVSLRKKKTPIFAPIYDTARGLFWNSNEEKIRGYFDDPKVFGSRLDKYANYTKPKIGWQGEKDLNHFKLIERIYSEDDRYKDTFRRYLSTFNSGIVERMIDDEFSKLITTKRRTLIKESLHRRKIKLTEIIEKN